jgi:hypothetical protein
VDVIWPGTMRIKEAFGGFRDKRTIGALERLVGKLALENEFLKGASRHARQPTSATTSVIAGPMVSRSPKDAD